MEAGTEQHKLTLLLVEDNPADVLFFQEAIEANGTPALVEVASDGIEAMQFLRNEGPYADARRPDVVVLDLNLPIKPGQEVLKEMASDSALKTIPVVILTTSTNELYICNAYPKGKCLYFAKTADFRNLQEIARKIAAHAITAQRNS